MTPDELADMGSQGSALPGQLVLPGMSRSERTVMLVRFSARNHPQQKTNPKVVDRETAPEVFGPLHERFRFTIDVAASAQNAKLPRYFTAEDDGLVQSWAGERVWCNPPYSNVRPWVEKAWRAWDAEWPQPEVIVMLLPAGGRAEQAWWQDLVEPLLRARRDGFRVEFLRGRLRFIEPGDTEVRPNARPPFGWCLLIWGQP
jgi:phage N-6-adenine-methyltransferase